MIRRLSVGVVTALLALGCTKSEPIAVPSDFSDPVRELLTAVDSGAAPTFKAETCANLPVDGPTDGARRIQSEATLSADPVVAVEKLRAAGIAKGWQPQEVDGAELALQHHLRDGVPIMLTTKAEGSALRVRVSVEYRCSSSGGFDFGRTGAPKLLPKQVAELREHQDTAQEVGDDVASAFGGTVKINDGAAVDCHTDESSGVQKAFGVDGKPIRVAQSTVAEVTAKATRTLGNGWDIKSKAEARRTVLTATGPSGLVAIINIANDPLTIGFQGFSTPCVPAG